MFPEKHPATTGRGIPLPLLSHFSAKRSATTCRYRCGDQCAHEAPNTSENTYFGDVVDTIVNRRGALKGAGVIALGAGGAAVLGSTAQAAESAVAATPAAGPAPIGLRFPPVAPNHRDAVTIPDGHRQNVVIRWGDPVIADAPEFDLHGQTPEAQEKQFGYNNDFAEIVEVGGQQLLVVNHEYTTEPHMFPSYDENNPTEQQVRISWAAHGLSVVAVEDDGNGGLRPVASRHNRRITLNTEFELRGPAAGGELLRTNADPSGTKVRGTLNNCAGSKTPWGTILSGEENIHQYFAHADAVNDPEQRERLERYGIGTGTSDRKWERFDQRWDVRAEPNEPNRFGWIVEIDPHDPDSTPVKHTALGRFKHESATIQISEDGRVVAYSGDDERFEYIYKFVSKARVKHGNSRHARRHNTGLLDEGTLYVGRFTGDSPESEIDGSGKLPADGEFDGSGTWLPLATGNESHVPEFTAEEVYVFTRSAADSVNATKMDRPEDIEPNPHNGRVYCALTNNSNRGTEGHAGPDEPNPRTGNKHGQVLEIDGDPTRTRFAWRLLLVCGDPEDPNTYFGGFDKTRVSPISCPDNVAFDPYGNLWISTDGNELGSNDGLFGVALGGPHRGLTKQFLTVPVGAETCGPVIREHFVLACVQHPGENSEDPDEPSSHWPDGGESRARPAVVTVARQDGGRIGG